MVRREELFTLEELTRAGERLKANWDKPGDAPRSLQLLSSGGVVLRRLEEAEVGSAEEGQQTSIGCLVI